MEAATTTPTRKLIATCGSLGDGMMSTRLAALMASGLWDSLHPDDRGSFTERGEVFDTPGGRAIKEFLTRIYDRD